MAESAILCPSWKCEAGASLIGIVLGDGSVAFSKERIVIDDAFVEAARQGRSRKNGSASAAPASGRRAFNGLITDAASPTASSASTMTAPSFLTSPSSFPSVPFGRTADGTCSQGTPPAAPAPRSSPIWPRKPERQKSRRPDASRIRFTPAKNMGSHRSKTYAMMVTCSGGMVPFRKQIKAPVKSAPACSARRHRN